MRERGGRSLEGLAAATGMPVAVLSDLFALGAAGRLDGVQAALRAVRGCARPIRLVGSARTYDVGSGEAVGDLVTGGLAAGGLLVPCGSRHHSVCPSCARLWAGDTWQLVRAGLTGGKGRAPGVRSHPRVFLTLTGPGFGAVHTRRRDRLGRPLSCRARRDRPVCAHGRPDWCGLRHPEEDRLLGSPLCAECFDYPGAVLFNAHAGALWGRWSVQVSRELARLTGRSVRGVRAAVKIEATRIAEMQQRGTVHLHAIVRADSGADPDAAAPEWVTGRLLVQAVTDAARWVALGVDTPVGEWELRFGPQIDAVNIASGASDRDEQRIASYLTKYVTKNTGLGVARRIGGATEIGLLPIGAHLRGLIGTAWRLGGLPELDELRLRRWAHQYGYRGPVVARSRNYSSSLRALKQARLAYRQQQADQRRGSGPTVTVTDLRFASVGLGPAGDWLAEGIRQDDADAREAAREQQQD